MLLALEQVSSPGGTGKGQRARTAHSSVGKSLSIHSAINGPQQAMQLSLVQCEGVECFRCHHMAALLQCFHAQSSSNHSMSVSKPADASRVHFCLPAVPVCLLSHCLVPRAASASAAGSRRPAFRRVGRGRKAYISMRALAQDLETPAVPPNEVVPSDEVVPADEVVLAGMLPAECAAGTCSKLWVSA